MKRRLAILAIGLMTMGTTSAILATAATAPAGATTSCSNVKNKFKVDPSPARLLASGAVTKTFTGRCLVPNADYLLHEPACGGYDTTLTTDFSGVTTTSVGFAGCTPGTYYTTLTEDFGAHKVYLVKERITPPVSCAAGASPTIDALPHNAPRMFGNTVRQTFIGECYPAFATVSINYTACGGGFLAASADAYGRFYFGFNSAICNSTGSFPLTVTAQYPPFGAVLATGSQTIDP